MIKHGFLILFCATVFFSSAQETVKQKLTLMGTVFEICAIHEDESMAKYAVEQGINEISRIESLISSHKPSSQTSMVNQMAGIKPVKVDMELYRLIERSLKLSKLTDGAFDISFAVTETVWDFKSTHGSAPKKEDAVVLKDLINYKNIGLNTADTTVFLRKKGMRIGFGAIGKGYAANMAKRIMTQIGIENGYVDASGDILFWGSNKGESWRVGIASPDDRSKALGWLEIKDMAVVTSGDYVYHIKNGDENLSHIIDPKTAWPVEKMRSVTVICRDAELADGLATSVSVLGPELGLSLINKLNGVECVLITADGKLYKSDNVNLNLY